MEPSNANEKAAHKLDSVRELGTRIDFGKTAGDYAKHRAGFPDAFFERLAKIDVITAGKKALDLGTGTGTVARGLATRGLEVTGLDKSIPLMEQAKQIDREAGVSVRYIEATAEATGLPSGAFDLVTAGQCWHWFVRDKAAAEVRRLLKPGGRLVIAHFDWIAIAGNVADATEDLIRSYNSAWNLWGGTGMYPPWLRDMGAAGYRDIESFTFDIDAPYSHEAWRGRVRASAGVGAAMPPERVAQFDSELAAILKDRFPEPMTVLHRVFVAIGVAPN
ncbi:MAG TPA: class I SAM-dependent methyltransferase [Candidatus Binataceae bacterium]|nr:class I SAM-dependent methyltransferase [Candidatus Binataceae bacterium]